MTRAARREARRGPSVTVLRSVGFVFPSEVFGVKSQPGAKRHRIS